ncbi:unnamed protein product [Symbiodinium microadriaticum]|nr:unnamed protein product [Symbiodinium microadriaticum]
MAADAPALVPETMDPVLFAWGSSEEVMTRLATGTGSVLVITKALNREAVVANSCLLGPLMKEHGADDGTSSDDSDSTEDDESDDSGSESADLGVAGSGDGAVRAPALAADAAVHDDNDADSDLERAMTLSMQKLPPSTPLELPIEPRALDLGGAAASSETSATEIVTPSPKTRKLDALGREPESPKSPQSLYKSWGLHYTVKDTKLGYLCLNCNRSHMDIGVFKLENCPAGTAWKKAKPEANPAPAPLKLEAAMPCITADAEIAAALQLEQAELERLNTLQALMTEQQHLEGLLAEMEAQIQAKQAQAAKAEISAADVAAAMSRDPVEPEPATRAEIAKAEAPETKLLGDCPMDPSNVQFISPEQQSAGLRAPALLDEAEVGDTRAPKKKRGGRKGKGKGKGKGGTKRHGGRKVLKKAKKGKSKTTKAGAHVDGGNGVGGNDEPMHADDENDDDTEYYDPDARASSDLPAGAALKKSNRMPRGREHVEGWAVRASIKGLDFDAGFQFIEIFSGAGHATKAWHDAGYKTASFDILYGTQMDFLKSGGMALALWMVLNLAPDGLVLNFMNVRGNMAKSWVGDGFSMVSISGDSMDDATWCTITKEEDFGTVAAKLDSLVRTNYRIYTATFGKNLLKAYTSWLATPAGDRADLRGREVVDLSLSDKEIFEGLQGEDEWIESGMHEVFEYLYRGTRLVCWDLTVSAKNSLQCRLRKTGLPSSMPSWLPKLEEKQRLMYRYFQPRKDGSLKCSPEALELYKSETGREALRNLLLKHGDFKTVEVHAKKYHRKLHQKLRVNAIHQDEEALLILNETFQLIDESGEEINMNGTFELEVDVPSPAAEPDKLAENKHARAAELSSSIREILAKLKENYKKLTTKQTDSISCKEKKAKKDKKAKVDSFVQPFKNTMTNKVLSCRLMTGDDNDDDLVEELFVSFAEGESGLREFPHGMGKGHDCALLGSWLLEADAVVATSDVSILRGPVEAGAPWTEAQPARIDVFWVQLERNPHFDDLGYLDEASEDALVMTLRRLMALANKEGVSVLVMPPPGAGRVI